MRKRAHAGDPIHHRPLSVSGPTVGSPSRCGEACPGPIDSMKSFSNTMHP
jgi:hypothetical protein